MVEVHAHGEGAIAAEVLEAVGSEEEGNEGHVAGIHGLEGEAGGGAVEVGVRHQILYRFQNLLQQASLHQSQLQHLFNSTTTTGKKKGDEEEE